jgi:hypothetical protein
MKAKKLSDPFLIITIWIVRLIILILIILAFINTRDYPSFFWVFLFIGLLLLWLIRKYRVLILKESNLIARENIWVFLFRDQIIEFQDIQIVKTEISLTATKDFILIYGGWNSFIKPSKLIIQKKDGSIFEYSFNLKKSKILKFAEAINGKLK